MRGVLADAERVSWRPPPAGLQRRAQHGRLGIMNKPKASAKRAIQQMVERIVAQFDPDQIILFGSHARGDAGPDSDVDLLVVVPVMGSRREKAIEIGVALHGIRVPKDIVVTTPEEFGWRRSVPGTIERPAALEGIVLYARA